MVHATSGVNSTDPLTLSFQKTTANSATDSFAQQLASAIEGYLGNIQNGSHFEIDVQSGQNQSFTVSVTNLAPVAAASSTAPAPSAPALGTRVAPAAIPATQTAPAATPVPAAATTSTIDKSQMTPTDAYWAEQPPAIQALRYTPDDQRGAAAQELAKQGYAIDVPIMVWGWDPLVTMTLRQNEGYTWVPSALQPNIEVGPGVYDAWNIQPYDPNNPPPGSIKVSTDFAIGSNGIDPYIHNTTAT
jgi:hypothetical protein